ncbi:EAL domain-containing protein [Propionivibrio dicarboxylicus]|uniref:PAS domain S-box-containing protein/diguanylate cyclase (GGDEF) domain-containing protein n=1 Tax=Propionivibrio dicarboxylicus TaxID=83767 RepID=A0A1G8ANB1_9RHOO|nr:EAL domain-containing protein [Propionivibrio dicarboxylicus]SDH22485.1 PAS domain S-box-containing protein/diguanylate cyclase (GGDEF) domain-containing protein [Propionivibrio dicarboxylicus]
MFGRLSFQKKLLLMIMPILMAGLLLLDCASYWYINRVIEGNLTTSMLETTGKTAETINIWLKTLLLEPETIASTAMAKSINNDFRLIDALNVDRHKVLHEKYPDLFQDIYAANGTGEYHTVRQNENGDFTLFVGDISNRDYFRSVMSGGLAQITPPLVSRTTGIPTVFLIAPIHDSKNVPQGLVGAGVSLEYVKKMAESLKTGKTGYGIVIGKDGLIIIHPDESLAMRKNIVELEDPSVVELGRRMIAGGSGMFSYVYQGVPKVAFYKPVPIAGWSVATIITDDELFAPVTQMIQSLAISTVAVLAVIAIMLILAAHRITQPILEVCKAVSRFASKDFTSRLPMSSRDELGSLAHNFNSMAETIQRHSETLERKEREFRSLTENSPDNIARYTPDARLIYINPALEQVLGAKLADVVGKRPTERQSSPVFLEYEEKILSVARTGIPDEVEFSHLNANGERYDTHIRLVPEFDEKQNVVSVLIIGRDITQRKLSEMELQYSMALINAALESTVDGILIVRDGKIVRWNQRFADLWQVPKHLLEPNDDKPLLAYVTAQMANPEVFLAKVEELYDHPEMTSFDSLHLADGRVFERYSQPMIIAKEIVGRYWSFRDVSAHKRAEDKIYHLAFFDQLTSLPNRILLQDRLRQAMAASTRNENYGALLLIDLDNFKILNDTLGHDMGDVLLQQVGQRLGKSVREEDTVARFGGDEFVVMLVGLGRDQANAATRSEIVGKKILTNLNQAFQLKKTSYHISASIGVALFYGQQKEAELLLKQADLALYRAKDGGRNTLRFFDQDMENAVVKRATMESELREALQKRQFVLHYQIQIAENKTIGSEVLVRWIHPQRGLISPAEFIPLAEENGLILPLGYWVLENACTQLAVWATQPKFSDLTIAVNVSAHQFRQSDFVNHVLTVLEKTGANPKRLKLELTESTLVSNFEDVIQKMVALKDRGISFSLDDFGTGYSSLSYLKRLPLDQLKIDQSFVRNVLGNSNDAAIVRTIIALADSLGLGVIAEGVETPMQRDFLSGSSCHAYQGYLFGRPVPISEFEEIVQHRFGDGGKQ